MIEKDVVKKEITSDFFQMEIHIPLPSNRSSLYTKNDYIEKPKEVILKYIFDRMVLKRDKDDIPLYRVYVYKYDGYIIY